MFYLLPSSQGVGWVESRKIFWERDHIHKTFVLLDCYSCSPLLAIVGFSEVSDGKESACNAGNPDVIPLVRENTMEKGTATCTSILAWRIERTEEPGRL